MRTWLALLACLPLAFEGAASTRQLLEVSGAIAVEGAAPRGDLADVAVWLTPAGSARAPAVTPQRFRMLQKDKRFSPDLLVIPIGSSVDFPNADPFFHNVFSMYDGKRFDLGLYESGASRTVTFTRPGVCYVFCNIHPEMSAFIVVVDTLFAAVSRSDGMFTIADLPEGEYRVSAWHHRYAAADGGPVQRSVTISESNRSLGVIRLVDTGRQIGEHKNKYGREYNPPTATSPIYKKKQRLEF
jgi:plastocyanin